MSNRQIQVVEVAGMYLLGSFTSVSYLLGSLSQKKPRFGEVFSVLLARGDFSACHSYFSFSRYSSSVSPLSAIFFAASPTNLKCHGSNP